MLFNFLIFNIFFVLFYYFDFLTFLISLNVFYFFLFIYFINYFIFKDFNKSNFNPNLDIFVKYIKFFTKNFFNLLNIIVTLLKKFYFFVYIKSFVFLKSIFIFLNLYIKNIFVIWRPLFKKWSYFGYFRTNRSKWIK